MSPKEDTKAKDGTVTVNIDDFTRTRDSVGFLIFLTAKTFSLLVLGKTWACFARAFPR